MTPITLASFPEELLERILSLCLSPPPVPIPRPSWHVPPVISKWPSRNASARVRTAPMLVSKSWLRIATPIVYHTLHVHSPAHAALLSRTLCRNPKLASLTRRLVVSGVWPELAPIARACTALEVLDITLDAGSTVEREAALETAAFCDALNTLDIHYLVVRKANVYLSQPKPRHVIAGLAKAIARWRHLVRRNFESAALSPYFNNSNYFTYRQLHTSISASPTTRRAQVPSSRKAFPPPPHCTHFSRNSPPYGIRHCYASAQIRNWSASYSTHHVAALARRPSWAGQWLGPVFS
jgi:hypothetical protein